MSESEYTPFSDPRRLFADGHAAKQAHRDHLGAIFAPREPEAADDEAVLDTFVDAVAERIIERLDQAEPEPERQVTGAAARGGFDGGARSGQPRAGRPETHAETLVRILRSRSGDVGIHL
jgi:hypothetical protein